MLAANFMFQHLTAIQKDKVFRVMTLRHVEVDEVIIKEGDKGDEMYIVDRYVHALWDRYQHKYACGARGFFTCASFNEPNLCTNLFLTCMLQW